MKYINNNPRRPYITAELKDRFLELLIGHFPVNKSSSYLNSLIEKELGNYDLDIIDGMFSLFNNDGMVDYFGRSRQSFDFILLPTAIEFHGKGGYTARDLLVEKQIRLIEAQLRELQSHSADKITSILEALNHLRQLFSVFFGS